MKVKASDLRYCNVLPSSKIPELAGSKLTGIKFLEGFQKEAKWYEFEEFIELSFDEENPNDNEHIAKTCGACGLCCKDIPNHQIGIYMSVAEHEKAKRLFPGKRIAQGTITSDGMPFIVVDVEKNGDCVMLGPAGCTLGEDRPLWCKIYHCEKYQGREYQFEKGAK